MDLKTKVKTGLDEVRMLVLGCQVLVGFQFQAVFQDAFDQIPEHSRLVNAAALLLMILALGLLITPSTYNALAEDQRATRRFTDVITQLTGLALFPFAVALGIDLMIAFERIDGLRGGLIAGIAFASLALVCWWGLEASARAHHGKEERDMASTRKNEKVPLAKQIDHMLTEARTILPGAQALLGFQLVVVLTKSFAELPDAAKYLHASALGLVALAVILLMMPAAYHRIVYAGEDSATFLRLGSRLVTAATVPLAFGLAADTIVTIEKMLGSQIAGLAGGLLVLILLIGLWYVYPLMERQRRRSEPSR